MDTRDGKTPPFEPQPRAIDELDGPTLARYAMSAGRQAHLRAAAEGFPVSVFVEGKLKLQFPDGRQADVSETV